MSWPVIYERKIRYSDTDAQKIVFNGNYFTYLDDSLTDYFDAMPGTWDQLEAEGYDVVLAHVDIDFRSPARFGETISCGVKAVEIGNTSIRFALRIWEAATDRLVVEGRAIHVVVDSHTLQKTAVPDLLIEAMESLQGEAIPRR